MLDIDTVCNAENCYGDIELVPIELIENVENFKIAFQCPNCGYKKEEIIPKYKWDFSEIGNGFRVKRLYALFRELEDADIAWICLGTYRVVDCSYLSISQIQNALGKMRNCRMYCGDYGLVVCQNPELETIENQQARQWLYNHICKFMEFTDNEWCRVMNMSDHPHLREKVFNNE